MTLNEAYEQYRCARTDENLEILYPLVKEVVRKVIGRFFQNNGDEDLVVNLTGDLLLSLDRFQGRSSFNTWVQRAARLKALFHLRKAYDSREILFADLPDQTVNNWANTSQSSILSELRIGLAEEEEQLLKGKLEGLSGEELAIRLGVPAGTIKSRWATLRTKLRESHDRGK